MMLNRNEQIGYLQDKRLWLWVFSAVGIYALFYTRYTISIAMFLIFILSLFRKEEGGWKWNWDLRSLPRSGMGQAAIALGLFFWVPLLSGFWSEETADFWVRIRIKIPFLLLPIAYYYLPRFRKREYIGLFYVLIATALISAIDVLVQYLQDFETYNLIVKRGGALPSPVNHVRYSLLVGFASIACFVMAYKRDRIRYRWEPMVLFGAGILLFAFLHVLAVRTGLATAYASLFFLSAIALYREKNWKLSLGVISLLILLPWGAYKTLPSFFQKINYAWTDFQALQNGEGFRYSDATRLRSFKIGKDIFLEHPYLGVGAGDLKKEAVRRFKEEYPENSKYVAPHNQWLTFLAGTGLLGFILLLGAFVQQLLDDRWKKDLLFLVLQIMIALSFMVENTLENSVGVGFYLFFTLIGLSYLEEEDFI
jgi:O-antigen ligase